MKFSTGLFLLHAVLFSGVTATQCQAQWTQQFQGTGSLLSVSFADANTAWAVGSQSVIYKTTTGGAQWVPQFTATGPETYSSVWLSSPNNIYVVVRGILSSSTDQLYASRDGGQTFDINRYGFFNTVYFQSTSLGFLVGTNGNMSRTTDGARLWDPLITGTTQNLTDVFFPSPQLGFIVGENGTLRRTTNGGTTWQAVNSTTTATLHAVYFTSLTTGYAVGSAGVALRTQNGGTTWTAMPVNTPVSLRDVFFKNSLNGYIVGDAGTILSTNDGGNTWLTQTSNTFESLNAVVSAPQSNKLWAVGGNGLVLVYDPTALRTVSAETATITAAYPNPFVDDIQVRLPAGVEGQAITLTDAVGRTVLSTTFDKLQKATLALQTPHVVPGVYQLTIATNKGVIIKRMLKSN